MRFPTYTPFFAIAFLTSASCQMALASKVVATITGTVFSASDNSGTFGPPNSELAGDNFSLVFTFDDTKGVQNVATSNGVPYFSSITSTASSNPGTAVLTINAESFEFGVLNAAEGANSEFARYAPSNSTVYLAAGDGHYIGRKRFERICISE
jgi:hypothetical protein